MAASSPDLPVVERQIVAETNGFRASQRLPPLVVNKSLGAAARSYADFLARTGMFAHGADGKTEGARAVERGYRPCLTAENLALRADSRGFTAAALARDVVEGWKGSPVHRKNLMLPHATDIGVAVAKVAGPAERYVSVQVIARPLTLEHGFRLENRTDRKVEYTLNGKRTALPAHSSLTHKGCAPAAITVHLPGSGWLSGTTDRHLAPAAGSAIALVKGRDGAITVESQAGAARTP